MTGRLSVIQEKKRALSLEITQAHHILESVEWRLKADTFLATDEFGRALSAEHIEEAVDHITETVIRDEGLRKVLLFPMDGALPYAASMLRSFEKKAADIPWVTVKATSYHGTVCGELTVELPAQFNFIDTVVYVADDVMDTGQTSLKIRDLLYDAGASAVKFIPLVDKVTEERKIQPWCSGFKISRDAFIVGFGLDYRKMCRNFKDIVVATPDVLPSEEESAILSNLPELKRQWLSLHREAEPQAAATDIQRVYHGYKARCAFFAMKSTSMRSSGSELLNTEVNGTSLS